MIIVVRRLQMLSATAIHDQLSPIRRFDIDWPWWPQRRVVASRRLRRAASQSGVASRVGRAASPSRRIARKQTVQIYRFKSQHRSQIIIPILTDLPKSVTKDQNLTQSPGLLIYGDSKYFVQYILSCPPSPSPSHDLLS